MDIALNRRALLLSMLSTAASVRVASAEKRGLELVDLEVDSDKRLARRCRVIVAAGSSDGPLPLLVLLHGLGETKSERLGVEAWLNPYGLASAWERLREGQVRREKEKLLSDVEADALNQSLLSRPFSGMVLVCPFMPNPYGFPGGSRVMLDRYASWLTDGVLPLVRDRIPRASRSREATGIAGVSLGGFAALELGLRAPRTFATVGTVQGAYRIGLAPEYSRRLSELGPTLRGVYVATSSFDPYRAANERLHRELRERAVTARLSVRRGPHSQGWLREIGTLETLLWHDRALRGDLETGEVRPPPA